MVDLSKQANSSERVEITFARRVKELYEGNAHPFIDLTLLLTQDDLEVLDNVIDGTQEGVTLEVVFDFSCVSGVSMDYLAGRTESLVFIPRKRSSGHYSLKDDIEADE